MKGPAEQQGRKLERGLLTGGLLAVCVLSAAFLIGAGAVNTISRKWEEEQLGHGIKSRIFELEAAIVPQVNWDDAVESLQNSFDPVWASANIGAYLTQNAGFHEAIVLDAADRPIYAVSQGEANAKAEYAAVRTAVAPLVERVRRIEARRGPLASGPSKDMLSRPIQATTVSRLDKAPIILTASLVQPDFGLHAPIGDRAPIVITGRLVDAAFVAELQDRYQIRNARLDTIATPLQSDQAQAVIADVAGKPIAALRWMPRQPGSELLKRISGVLTIALGALVIIILLAQRATRSAFNDLLATQKALRGAVVRAETADRAKSDFLTAISHEIRTPLNSVFGALHLLKAEPISAEGAALVTNALGSGQMVNALVDDILDFSRIEAGTMTLEPRLADLMGILESVRAAFAAQCAAKNIALSLQLSPTLGWAVVDELRLRQCLFNLVGNAVKFTEAGAIAIRADRDGERLRIEIQDSGVGIGPRDLDGLFDRFTQVDGSMTRRYAGVGLGLAITRQLAGLMQGGVEVESRLGEGSTFTLTVVAPPAEAPVQEPAGEGAPLEGLSILLVDDNEANLVIGSKILERLGASVTTADGGEDALERLQIYAFDLVLMDIQMPGMDGMETTRRLKSSCCVNSETPVIALTANVLDEQKAAYARAGMEGVVAKPIVPLDLLYQIVSVATAEDASTEESSAAA